MLPPIPQLPIRRRRAVAPKDNGYPRTAAGRILWYLKRLEARQEPKDTVADAPADTAAADTTPEGSGTEG